jgi:hydrogenase/urease accessory protein HupE
MNAARRIGWSLALLPVVLLSASSNGAAHPLAPALLELHEIGDGVVEVSWKTSLVRLPGSNVRPVLPPHCQQRTPPRFTEERTSVTERWTVRCDPAGLSGRRVGADDLGSAKIDVLVRATLADGRIVRGVVRAREPLMTIPERDHPLEVFRDYLVLGTEHIVFGPDHLLFVFGLLLLVGTPKLLALTITAFTVGHSVTLTLAVLGVATLPSRPIEVAIALSVFVLAVELARGDTPSPTLMRRFPWVMALLFGLLHGLGFAGALREIGLPSTDIPAALLSFNIGIEIGQLGFVFASLAAWWALRSGLERLPRWTRALPIYAMGSLAALWCIERAVALFR